MTRSRALGRGLRTVGLTALLIMPRLTGCAVALLGAGAAAGAGGYAYVKGEASQTHAGSFDQVWNATTNALNQMNITVVNSKRDALGGEIDAKRAADNQSVTVKVQPVDASTTRVSVRVGLLGNEADSKRIQQAISTTLASR